MKSILHKAAKVATCLTLGSLLWACSDVFDELSINPNQSDVSSFYVTPENCNKGVLGIYGYISTPRNLGACGFGLMLTRSDEGCSVADYGVPGAYNEEFTPSYYSLVQPFQLMYTAASQSNQIIESLTQLEFGNKKQHDAYLGEAYFLRAFSHFFLFMNYRNIPLIKELPKAPNEYKPQATPEETWDFIIGDLIKAKDLLPEKDYWDEKNKGRVTKASAYALLGKAYLYRSGIEPKYGTSNKTYYDEAADAFAQIINGNCGGYELVEDYDWNFDLAHENNDESIFEVQFVGVLGTGFNPGFVDSGLFNDVRCKMCILNKNRNSNGSAQVMHNWLYDIFSSSKTVDGKTDPRMFGSFVFNDYAPEIIRPEGKKVTFLEDKDWISEFGSQTATFGDHYEKAKGYKMCSRKWLDWTLPSVDDAGGHFFNGRAQGVNWRMIRYSDVLLMYAESVVMGGTPKADITPLEAVNQVRRRATVPEVSVVDMETIERERILELTYEGTRFFDLLRWGKLVQRFRELESNDPLFKQFSRAQYMGFKENKNEWLPLPIDEVEGNPYITKNNPGW